jgi:hypothetical protein
VSNDKIKMGYWSIAAQKHLKVFQNDSTGLMALSSLNLAGKAGRFIGAIRGNKQINELNKLFVVANNVGITSKHELIQIILPALEKASDGRIELIKDTTGNITGIAEYVFEQSNVLEIAGQVFENDNPSNIERIVIDTMDETKKIPYLKGELTEKLVNKYLSERDISLSLALQAQFRLIQILSKSKSQEEIISNEYVWGKDHKKIALAISQLSLKEKEEIKQLIEIIQKTQGLPAEKLAPETVEFLTFAKKIGMINPVLIKSTRGIDKEFEFSADLLKPEDYKDDILDDVKLLLASIRFGQHYTPYSTIEDPKDFLTYLINNGEIGPHDANLTDYILLERRGIVRVVNKTKSKFSRYYGAYVTRSGPFLELVRKDVAEEALKIITNPNYTMPHDTEVTGFGSIMDLSSSLSPEEIRISMGESTDTMQEVAEEALRILRGENL